MPKERIQLRSLTAEVCTHVQFYNSTNRQLKAYWIDYDGDSRLQFMLDAKSSRSINTFLTHPWYFRDAATGQMMQVEHFNIFLPQYYSVANPNYPSQRLPCRKQIVVHLPAQTLKDICLWEVNTLIKENKDVDSVINQLEIPWTLKKEMKLMLKRVSFK